MPKIDSIKLRASSRKLDRLNSKVTIALGAMRRGEALYLEHRWHGPVWCLSISGHIDAEVAEVVIRNSSVTGVGDALAIDGARPQTWRWVEDRFSQKKGGQHGQACK
jgi:hypothetical protein